MILQLLTSNCYNKRKKLVTNRGIMLPSYPGLKEEQQEYIINCLKENLSIK